jgi:hypothetical protein
MLIAYAPVILTEKLSGRKLWRVPHVAACQPVIQTRTLEGLIRNDSIAAGMK